MKTCACCGDVAAIDADACDRCGESSWIHLGEEGHQGPLDPEDPPKSERQPEPQRDGRRRKDPR